MNITVFSILVLSLVSACGLFRETDILREKLKSGEPYFAIAYTRSFAQRFNMPATGVVNFPDHLKATSIEINEVNGFFTCDLHLYLDSTADIFIPSNGEYFSEKTESEQFYISRYNDKDQEWNSKNLDNNSMRIRFESRETVDPKNRFVKTLSYKRVHENFLPGLTIITIDTQCDVFETEYYPADIWIQKKDLGSYRVGNDQFGSTKQLDKNHSFEIPVKLINQITPYMEIAVKSNQKRRGY